MTWVKIDDELPWNLKVSRLSDAAFRVYLHSICYSGKFKTDGDVGAAELALIPHATIRIARELVSAGVWETRPDGWYVHDYLVHNRSRQQIEATSGVRAEAGRKGGQKSKPPSNEPSNELSKLLSNELSPSGPPNARSALSDPDPRDLDPETGEILSERTESEASKKPSKLLSPPKRTTPTEEWAEEMRERYGPYLRDFNETLSFHMNGSYYRSCQDKCGYLEGRLKRAAEREGRMPAKPDDDLKRYVGGFEHLVSTGIGGGEA